MATSLKISTGLKRRIDAAAKAADKSPHAFMLDAIEQQTRLDEQRRSFVAEAIEARNEAISSGSAYAAGDVRRFLMARSEGRKVNRPKPVAWRK